MEMNQQMQYRPGDPDTYFVTRSFDLGNTGLKAIKGDQVNFDGTLLTMPGHPPVSMPQLRGAVKVRWLVLAQQYDPMDNSAEIPQPAGMQIRPAEGGNPLNPQPRQPIQTAAVESDEREVANVAQHAAATRERNKTNYRRGGENRAVMPGDTNYVIEEQDGVVVRGLQTPAVQDVNVMNASSAISAANAIKVQAGEAPTREDVMAAMTPRQAAEYQQELAAHKASYDPEGASRDMQAAATVVRRVRPPGPQQREGINVTGSVGGGTEVYDAGGTGGATAAQESVVEEDGVLFRNTNGPKKDVRLVDKKPAQAVQTDRQVEAALADGNGADDTLCRTIARAICPDFPDNYVFADPIRKKIARLQADYDDRPDIIKAVAAAETDAAMKARVVEEFPGVFQ